MEDDEADRVVHCAEHGARSPAFVCHHLVAPATEARGFHQADVDPNREWTDLNGWCDECDRVYLAEQGWNDTSEGFAQIQLVCDACFFQLKARHGPKPTPWWKFWARRGG